MNLAGFRHQWADLKPASARAKLLKVLENLITDIQMDEGDNAVSILESGFLDPLVDLEADDFFGTEGMSL